ncbi:trafficking protein particle complex subunit 1-like isoform X3 [Artemia franciscana]|uniref:trafficking protein particle complex subunit 1-like isoform X3 n=1 Tax=Artemia franciscana TaxID=6661 RepID=UPI0032DB586B
MVMYGLCLQVWALWAFGRMLFYHEWQRKKKSRKSIEQEGKLMFGMLHSLQSFVSKMSPVSVKDKFLSYKTNKYCLTMLEPPSGVKFVINTDVSSSGVQELVHTIYKQVYVEYITMNPIIEVGEEIKCELFRQKLDNLIKQSVIHSSKAE